MIAAAVYSLLSTLPVLTAQFSDRVYPTAFAQAETFPALTYNLKRSVGAYECRGGSGATKSKLLELGLLASSSEELQTLSELLDETLIGYAGIQAGYYLQIEANDDDFDEDASDLNALFKRSLYDLTATKL